MTNPEKIYVASAYDIETVVAETRTFVPRERDFMIDDATNSIHDFAHYIWQGNFGRTTLYHHSITEASSVDGTQSLIGSKIHWYPREMTVATTCFKLITNTGALVVSRDYHDDTELAEFDVDSEESANAMKAKGEDMVENLTLSSPSDWNEFQLLIASGRRHFETERRKPRLVKSIERASTRLTAYLAQKL